VDLDRLRPSQLNQSYFNFAKKRDRLQNINGYNTFTTKVIANKSKYVYIPRNKYIFLPSGFEGQYCLMLKFYDFKIECNFKLEYDLLW